MIETLIFFLELGPASPSLSLSLSISLFISLSFSDACARGKDWIEKIKQASILVQYRDTPEPNTKTKDQQQDPLACEPKHKSFKDAQKAAQRCNKCVTTSNDSKGCRACMGEYFEQIRQKGFMARAFKG